LIEATPLIVVGYRGAEPSIMKSLLGPDTGIKFRHGIFWCLRTGDTPHPNVEAPAQRLGPNFQFLEIDGFDELMGDLNRELAGVQRFAPLSVEVVAPQFDDHPVMDATWADVNADLALTTLRQYCAKLERGAIDSHQLKPLMRELGLLVPIGGDEKPSAACLLLFGRDPGRFFTHSVITATIAGKKRRNFAGSLIEQYKATLEWFDQEQVNPVIKVKVRRQHAARTPYPERALVELLVNMIVHRDYAIANRQRSTWCPTIRCAFSIRGQHFPRRPVALRLGPMAILSRSPNSAICVIGPYATCFSASAPWSELARASPRCASLRLSEVAPRASPIRQDRTVSPPSCSGSKPQRARLRLRAIPDP
jgi:hypothetical protein